MTKLKQKRPAPGTVFGLLALVVAIGGTAHAATSHPQARTIVVRRGEIAKGAVGAKALARGAVHTKAIAKGAVHPKALAKGAVGPAALASGAVGGGALAADAVGAGALAPGSVYGGALGEVTTHTAPIADLDAISHNGEWTASNTVAAPCAAGERILSGGVFVTNPGDRQVAIIESIPYADGGAQGWTGAITSDSGGTATAEVKAFCLK
ncbi:MAG TPA: hypothetical protein VHU86_04450 [Solirubrobacterales bacterium]|jgi:hypothetical protein|nr:hypothetical protein [Solirubrobacterales bacterium]